ncbi:hypothetical protein BC833DRAFT_592995 [Globomyces pollinis-pini]|nr:hypothetical protein BC833DRAFT_592995 [Globomyces pollinis-pini]
MENKTGSFIFPSGSKYDGEYKEVEGLLIRNGQGVHYCNLTQSTYTGQWENDKMNGKGRIDFASGAHYEGLWKDNQYQGQGVYGWSDGSTLSGEWNEQCVNGSSLYQDADKQIWTGDITKGMATILTPNIYQN